MHYCDTGFVCPHERCGSTEFYAEQQLYDGTHEKEDKEYAWANVPEHLRGSIVVIEADGTISSPPGYRQSPNRWTTKAQRDANPDLAKRCDETKVVPLVAVADYTWFKCSKCNKEIDTEWAKNLLPKWEIGEDGKIRVNGNELVIYEEIGAVFINNFCTTFVEPGEHI